MRAIHKYREEFSRQLKLWLRTFRLIWAVVPGWTACWFVLLIVLGIVPGFTVYLTKLTIDGLVAARADLSHLNTALLFLVLTGCTLLLTEVLRFALDWVRAMQGEVITDYLKDAIQKKATEVDIDFYESSAYYDLLEQVRSNAISRPITLLESFGSVFQSVITLLAFSTLLISYGWWVPVLLLLGSLPGLYIYFRSERMMHDWLKASSPERRWLSYLESVVTTDQTAAEVRIFGLGGHFRKRYRELSVRLRAERMRHIRRRFSGRLVASFIALLTAAAALGWMTLKVLYNTASLGDLAVFYQVFSRGQTLMQSLLGGVNQAFSSGLYLSNLFEFLDLEPSVKAPDDPVPFPTSIKSGIQFSKVTFHYPGTRTPALKDFDLFIPAGKVVAVVGVNGAGKSTLVKLLCRFYDPSSGAIEIDGININAFDPAELRRNLSVHFQFPVYYHETAKANIEFGDITREPTEIELFTAAETAGADEFIGKLPQKYQTMLGRHFVDGQELSGGQWQRIALARAYYRKAPILILDEPTSFMDSWSELEWFNRLRELLSTKTGLIITHRFTIAMRADTIHVVNDGEIIESGSHRELLDRGGFYAKSWESQMHAAPSSLPPAIA